MRSKSWKKRLNGLLALSLVVSMVLPVMPMDVRAETAASDLIISEYVEGSSFNKAIELYNGTAQSLDLQNYALELYANGATTATNKLGLTGSLPAGETFVVYHRDASAAIKQQGDLENSTVTNFNGDDALVLKKANNVIDSFGQVGARSNWGTDVTLVRKPTIVSGDAIADDAFTRDAEWIVYPKDTFEHLGTHEMDGADPGEPGDPSILPIVDARALPVGETVTIKGIVAAKLKNTISVQDASGGIAVRPTSLAVAVGDEVTLQGTLADYRGLLQLDGAQLVDRTENVGEPAPKVVTGDAVGEANESQLVTVHNVVLTDVQTGSSWANFMATDGHPFIVRDETASLGLTVGTTYDSITGIVQQFDNDYQVIPRSVGDVIVDSTIVQPVVAQPGSGTFVGSVDVSFTTGTANATILYTLDGSNPIEHGVTYATPITIQEDATVKAVAKTDDGRYSEISTFTYTIAEQLAIHDIQGDGHTSPFVNEVVEGVEGIVTYKYELKGSTYYHIQTPDAKRDGNLHTSEAIVLYSGRDVWNLAVGDLVSVTGTVSEYAIDGYADRQETDLKTTQINVRNDRGGHVEVLGRNVPLPTPFMINEENLPKEQIASEGFSTFDPTTYAADFWESREAMLVQVGDVKAVSPQQHGDLVTVFESVATDTLNGGLLLKANDQNAERIQFRLEPNGPARDFEVATGDRFTGPLTGVVGYSFQNYKIYASLDEMRAAHVKGDAVPEQTTIVKAEDKLTIASYNLENFSNNKKTTTDEKARKLARAFAVDMQSPDIIGVTEVQDNNGPDAGDSRANESYERLIQAIVDAGGPRYAYVNIDPVYNEDGGQPNANIRVGFLYNPARVSLTQGMPHGDATTAAGYVDGKLTHNPGRIDPNNAAFANSRKPLAAQFDFQGESVVVIANHWNSKRGDTPLFGATQPPVYGSEVQRKQIARIVYDFISDIKTDNPEANVVSLGDFNDFQFAESLLIHEGDLMTNMVHHVPESDRYSYVFQGNSQVLDHILVSNNLVEQTEVDMLHINADYTDMAGRASDHDPVIVQIGFEAPVIWEPVPIQKEYRLVNEHKKKLMIAEPSVAVFMDGQSSLKEGVYLKGDYAELTGDGFKTNRVILQPKKKGLIVNMKGTEMGHVIVEGSHPLEIRGAENIRKIDFVKGADASKVVFYNSKGKRISVPVINRAPIVVKPIANKEIRVGDSISIPLPEHFNDPDGDPMTYSATKGTINLVTGELRLQLEEGNHIVGVTATDGDKSVTTTFTVIVTAEEVENPTDDYYRNALGKEGQALKDALHDIISDHRQLAYSEVWAALRETDSDPNNTDNVILFYSGKSRSKDRNGGNVGDWNREHVWAKSHGDFGTSKGPGTDIHHLRPTDVQVNSARGNLDFDNGGSPVNGCDGCFKTANSWEPPDRVKGDVARMLFYMATRYEAGDRVDLELNELLNNGNNPYHGKLSVLLEWHEQDPVDAFEMNRNDVIEQWQGNRNPFIDHPEWVQSIWKKAGSSDLRKAS
ncbi:endonuclease [Sporosarcina saromensis]|uniref:Endonuclease n=1 Tax=Sporosarcina saromensis TaxID=359365 RepID=A0ABU4G6A1_9BACL|nr:endonuclease [Sporosarcina saromensis]MDW0112504.1 endonuclease [Sporosarcina saromensis]